MIEEDNYDVRNTLNMLMQMDIGTNKGISNCSLDIQIRFLHVHQAFGLVKEAQPFLQQDNKQNNKQIFSLIFCSFAHLDCS